MPKAKNWNEVDDAKLAKLFKDETLDPKKLEAADIKKANLYWPDRKCSSFAKLYRRKCRKWNLEQTLAGKRRGQTLAGKRRGPKETNPTKTKEKEVTIEDFADENGDDDDDCVPEEEEDVELQADELDEEVVVEEEEPEIEEVEIDEVEQVTESVAKMAVTSKRTKAANSAFKSFNLSFSCPWMCYSSTDNGRKICTVEFLMPNVHRSACKLKIGPCGTVLYCGIAVPKDFYDASRTLDANQHDNSYNINTSKAAAFGETCQAIDYLVDDNDEVIGDPMAITLPFKVEDQFYKSQEMFDNEQDGWEVLMIDNNDSKLIKELNEGLAEGEEIVPPDHFVLEVNMVSVVKPKTKKVKGKMRKVKARPTPTFDAMSSSATGSLN